MHKRRFGCGSGLPIQPTSHRPSVNLSLFKEKGRIYSHPYIVNSLQLSGTLADLLLLREKVIEVLTLIHEISLIDFHYIYLSRLLPLLCNFQIIQACIAKINGLNREVSFLGTSPNGLHVLQQIFTYFVSNYSSQTSNIRIETS